jgi:hypothetical protein
MNTNPFFICRPNPSAHYDAVGLPTKQPHQKPRGASRNRSESGAFLTTDGSADCRRDACGCRYQESFFFPRSAFPAAPYHDPCVHIHLLKEISDSTSTPRSQIEKRFDAINPQHVYLIHSVSEPA